MMGFIVPAPAAEKHQRHQPAAEGQGKQASRRERQPAIAADLNVPQVDPEAKRDRARRRQGACCQDESEKSFHAC